VTRFRHLGTDPPPGAQTDERHCDECRDRTVWFRAWHEGYDDDIGRDPTPGWWEWQCSGRTREELAQP
jgi:hypothetical protein